MLKSVLKKGAWFQENALWFESFPWWRVNLCHTRPPVVEVNKRHIGFAGGLWCVFKVAILKEKNLFHKEFSHLKHKKNTSNPQIASMTSGIFTYWTYLLPTKIYTIHVGKYTKVWSSHHPHLHLRVEILVPLPWLRHERSDEDFRHLPGVPLTTLPTTMDDAVLHVAVLQKCGKCFFRNVTQEEHSYKFPQKGCQFQTGKLNKTHKSYCTQHQQSFPHSHVAENRQKSSTTRHIFPHVPVILGVWKKKNQRKPRRSNLWYSSHNCQANY